LELAPPAFLALAFGSRQVAQLAADFNDDG
jgi:hypothetical protein